MVWIILFFASVALFVISIIRDWQEFVNAWWLVFSFVFFFLIIGISFSGISDYAYLISEREKTKVLIEGISEIKKAYYKENNISKNSIINGSLDNIKQSTNLSEYISKVYEQKSKFNSYLIKCKTYQSEFIYGFWGDGFFISEKVHEIEPIE